jgi:hypothetical protein
LDSAEAKFEAEVASIEADVLNRESVINEEIANLQAERTRLNSVKQRIA